MTTDANGQVSFTGFRGEYEVALDKQHVAFEVKDKGESQVSVSL